MSEWREKKLEDLAQVDTEIRKNQEEAKRIAKEYRETIKDLESIRDSILDKLAGESGDLFDDGDTTQDLSGHIPTAKSTIELDEEKDELEAPEPGTRLGDEPEEDAPPPEEPPPLQDPAGFMGQ